MLLISQATMCGIFILKGVQIYAAITIVIMVMTIYYTFYLTAHYSSLNRLPLELAVSFDSHDKELKPEERAARTRRSLGPRNNAGSIFQSQDQVKRRQTAYFDIEEAEDQKKYSQFVQPELLDDAEEFASAAHRQIAAKELATKCYGPAKIKMLWKQLLYINKVYMVYPNHPF